ncbi:toprim domain-containing protein [Craurococcus roseus]|uniref:Toprim domain-containing protein n=1 Tax=Craurococcus roseus TaxID=77585 RepID=A0ABN1EQC6_9PROT
MLTFPELIRRSRDNPALLSSWEAGFLADMDGLARHGRQPTGAQRAALERIARRIAPADLARDLARRIESLARELICAAPTSRRAGEVRFRSRGSLAVRVGGRERGQWYDHEAGKGGDALGWLGRGPVGAEPPAPAPSRGCGDTFQRWNREMALGLWREAVPLLGSLAEAYLRSRGLSLPHGAPLRFHPACRRGPERLPAMVALMTGPTTGEPCGVHRTFLALDGTGKAPPGPSGEGAKMMLGAAGVVRLTPDEDVTLGLGLCEGIETGLALLQRFGHAPVWAAAAAGAVARFPLLHGIEALTVFADADAPGLASARACKARWAEAGREVRVVWPGQAGRDFADRAA